LLLFSAASGARADVIHLKNGRSIWADHVRENGSRIEYDLGDDSYAVPKSSVDRVDSGGIPPQYPSTHSKSSHEVPVFSPASNIPNEAALGDEILRDGKVDIDALSQIEQAGDARNSAAAYFLAGKHEFEGGNFPGARKYFEAALRFDSQNATVLNYYAALLVRAGSPSEALLYAERAARVAPDSADTLAVLGYAQFASDRTADAIRSWKRSLAIRPDSMIQHYLEKAERESKAESDFSQHESGHFTLKYEGKQTSDSLRRGVVDTLESDYDELARELGIAPRGSISVTLYTDQAFFDVTQAPSWSGAVNDGKLRIPVDGVSEVTPELARVLKHELSHSFINQLSSGRCPQWLNEGVAQVLEPKSVASHGRRLAQLFKAQQQIPYNVLEGSFMQFSTAQAVVAYDESLAAVQYINDTYGMSDITRILERIGQGSSSEAALRATIHSDYGQMESEVARYLTDKYGD
jgi:Tfp pilus assembly protein PilF